MIRAMVLIGAILLFTGAPAGDELRFPDHGFSIELAEDWVLSDISPLYESYVSTNKKAFGEAVGKRIGTHTGFLFKANRDGLSDEEAVFTCALARNTMELDGWTAEQRDDLLENASLSSYKALVSRGLDVTRPTLHSNNGIEYRSWTQTLTQADGIVEFKAFFSDKGLVICAGGGLSSYAQEIESMHDSIARMDGREAAP